VVTIVFVAALCCCCCCSPILCIVVVVAAALPLSLLRLEGALLSNWFFCSAFRFIERCAKWRSLALTASRRRSLSLTLAGRANGIFQSDICPRFVPFALVRACVRAKVKCQMLFDCQLLVAKNFFLSSPPFFCFCSAASSSTCVCHLSLAVRKGEHY